MCAVVLVDLHERADALPSAVCPVCPGFIERTLTQHTARSHNTARLYSIEREATVESLLLLSLLLSLCRSACNKMEKTAKVVKEPTVGRDAAGTHLHRPSRQRRCDATHSVRAPTAESASAT